MQKNYSQVFKKTLLFFFIAIVIIWVGFVPFKNYKIYSANKRYFKNFVRLGNYDFNIYKKSASINVAIENLGDRLLSRIILKIGYYNTNGKFLGVDSADILKMTGNVLYPKAGKIFRINVTCPENTSQIKLRIN